MMSIGSIVTGVAMVAARLRVPDNTIGQTAFTLLFAVVFVVLIHALVVGARNNKLDAYGFGPRVSNMIVIGCIDRGDRHVGVIRVHGVADDQNGRLRHLQRAFRRRFSDVCDGGNLAAKRDGK